MSWTQQTAAPVDWVEALSVDPDWQAAAPALAMWHSIERPWGIGDMDDAPGNFDDMGGTFDTPEVI